LDFASSHDWNLIIFVAAKYKEYTRLKNLEASLARREKRHQEHPESHSKKRKHASPTGPGWHVEGTPRKSSKGLFATPSNNRTKEIHPSQLDPYDSPSTFRRLFSPSTHRQSLPAPSPLKAAIGPTPQRDGKSLGLFDMLSESGGSHATPSAKKQKDVLAAGFQTPSKHKTFEPIAEAPDEEETSRLSRTPASSTKQFYLANLFATPTTMRYAAMVEAEDEKADQQNPPQQSETAASEPNPSETPSFLRRSNFGRLPPPTHDSAGLSPIASRKPLQFAGKGLSHIVQGLRAMEEERNEDEWDMLREIEAEQEAAEMNAPENHHLAEQNHRPYKKKGQKRTTRRVVMRPVAPRPKPKPTPSAPIDESDDELAAVPETQLAAGAKGVDDQQEIEIPDDIASLHSVSGDESDFDPQDADSDDDPGFGERPKPLARAKSFSERIKEAVGFMPKSKEPPAKAPEPESAKEKEENKKVKKVNPQAHANYRSLKIHRGRGRGGGRFRRR